MPMEKNWDNLLAFAGLTNKMTSDMRLRDEKVFISYLSKEYKDSSIFETDEVYGFRNVVFLHRETGLRFEYAVHENYNGELECKILDVFIKSQAGKRIVALGIDIARRKVLTKEADLHFQDIKRDIVGD